MSDRATAFAPATVGNAAVGFDVLGFAVDAVGDRATVQRIENGVRIGTIRGVVTDLPRDPASNTATVGLELLVADHQLDFGFEVDLHKGIPLGSGMGGSAASAVAAIVAANELLAEPLSAEQLFGYALAGEAVASGHAHPDNVAPCLYGGVTLATQAGVRALPAPELWVALAHPDLEIETRIARDVLPAELSLVDAVAQMGHLAAFVDACHRGDPEAVAQNCVDLIAEPHRKQLVPGFDDARAAAFGAGALAFSLSGSGPTVFALTTDRDTAEAVVAATIDAFDAARLSAQGWVSPFGAPGARLS